MCLAQSKCFPRLSFLFFYTNLRHCFKIPDFTSHIPREKLTSKFTGTKGRSMQKILSLKPFTTQLCLLNLFPSLLLTHFALFFPFILSSRFQAWKHIRIYHYLVRFCFIIYNGFASFTPRNFNLIGLIEKEGITFFKVQDFSEVKSYF